METKRILLSLAFVGMLFSTANSFAQDTTTDTQPEKKPFLSTLRLEARADFKYNDNHTTLTNPTTGDIKGKETLYGFTGRYFNLHMGGNLTDKFSYYFRQRINANPGNIKFFDHTDFLYLNYQADKHWSLRFGKDALAVGGFEYDAAPIDILFNGYYWDVFYCFQLAVSGAYTSNDGNHTVRLQLGNSPYIHTGADYESNLFSYNLLWSGNMNHWKTLYSLSAFERSEGSYMGYFAMGNKLDYNKWSVYLDLIARADTWNDMGQNYAAIARFDYKINPSWTLFCKGAYTRNGADDELDYFHNTGNCWDCLSLPDQKETYAGVGFTFRPASYQDIRFHGFVEYYTDNYEKMVNTVAMPYSEKSLRFNAGITWNINFLQAYKKITSIHI